MVPRNSATSSPAMPARFMRPLVLHTVNCHSGYDDTTGRDILYAIGRNARKRAVFQTVADPSLTTR